MQLGHFQTLRSGVQRNASPVQERALVAMERILRDLLSHDGVFDRVEVGHTDDPDQLLVGLCQFRPDVPDADVIAVVERLWETGLRFPFWEAHTTLAGDGFVELEGATRESVVGRYLTVHLVAQRASVPAQRSPVEQVEPHVRA
jgi:hypothetical protein